MLIVPLVLAVLMIGPLLLELIERRVPKPPPADESTMDR